MAELRHFKDVFADLSVGERLAKLLDGVFVERVILNKHKNILRIFLISDNWIRKQYIYDIEKAIAAQLLPESGLTVVISEKFRLSGQYVPEKFYELYRPSMMLELKKASPLLHEMMRETTLSFPEPSVIVAEMPENIVFDRKGEELEAFLEKIFCDRAGFHAELHVQMKETSRRDIFADDEEFIHSRVREVVKASSERKQAAKAKEEKKLNAPQEKRFRSRQAFISRDPDLIYGRTFEGTPVPIAQVPDEPGEAVIRGEVFSVEEKETKSGKTIFTIALTDHTDSIRMKLFSEPDDLEQFRATFKKGAAFLVKGMVSFDPFDREVMLRNVYAIKRSAPIRTSRTDTAAEKRIELHCHTKMSDMDAVSSAKDIIRQAYEWGHKAIAITDHGVVQAFPEALHTFGDKGGIPKDADFKVIYGMEAYLVDDGKNLVHGATGEFLTDPHVVFSTVTTGQSPHRHKILEIAAVRVEQGKVVDTFFTRVDPKEPIPFAISEVTGISDEDVQGEPTIDKAIYSFLAFADGAYLAAYDAEYEVSFLEHACRELGVDAPGVYVDIPQMAMLFLPDFGRVKFEKLAKAVRVECAGTIRAQERAECMQKVYEKLISKSREEGIDKLSALNLKSHSSKDSILHAKYFHAIILAASEQGRRNLYRLVSESHLNYFRNRPRIPKSLMQEFREGLIFGSACSAGELYQALLRGASNAEIASIVEFYDYLEVQPVGNNAYLVRDHVMGIESVDQLRELNRRIVKLGDQFGKPVVATCDVHFLNPEDAIYRQIIQVGHGYPDEEQPPLYLHTTKEMLEEFSYLGEEKAKEIVVTNPAKICAMCERISPIHPDKCPPSIENSEQILTDSCYKKAKEMYGDPLPAIVENRLKKELTSIIGNGYAVMYIIAQKLVAKSEEDGYLVGSRGSVGSSLAATMSSITEVNPLPPHYYCPACHYSDFDSPEVKAYAGKCGSDMPDKACPVCGKPLKKDGFDIPFETFLGFKGNKEPDIDLNFSGDEQGVAQAYTEEIFGKGQTFKAGTIGTVAEKTAIGFTKGFFEQRGIPKRQCEIERLADGCTGIRRTTGQHPGGVIVLPKGMDINWFTPVQHPANDVNSTIITTHFDYHSIDQNLLKLDILGHDDPTMIRMLQDLTGVDPRSVAIDDPGVLSLFNSTDALGIKPEDIGGVELGVLGIPEFGTSFVIGMLRDTKPTSVSELVRISGLSHGTNVWLDNAQELIRRGDATLSTAICTRDDIMLYLISKGMEPEHSFKTMESVRKGKGLTPEMEEEMVACGVPEWYIWSCKQIKYMFPKAHAAAYVTNALRIAYYKVHDPLAYYAAYFSIRASGFSYEKMCLGREKLEYYIHEYENMEKRTATEDDTLRDMYLAREMYARGFRFLKMDIYKAGAKSFRILDGALMPALNTIDGLGDAAAESIELAASKGEFLSKDDFRNRAHVSKTIADQLGEHGILGDIPESNQISLFDIN